MHIIQDFLRYTKAWLNEFVIRLQEYNNCFIANSAVLRTGALIKAFSKCTLSAFNDHGNYMIPKVGGAN